MTAAAATERWRARPTATTDGAPAPGSHWLAAILAAADGVMAGLVAGGVVAIGALLVGTAGATAWASAADLEPARNLGIAQSLGIVLVLAAAAYTGGRRAALAMRWEEPWAGPRDVALLTALGAIGLLLSFLFVIPLPMDPVLAAGEVVVVALWAVGAMASERWGVPRLDARRWIALSLVLGAGVFAAAGPIGARPFIHASTDPDAEMATASVGASLPADEVPPIEIDLFESDGRVDIDLYGTADPAWTDLRLELWAAEDRRPTEWSPRWRVADIDATMAGPIRSVEVPRRPLKSIVIRIDNIRGLTTAAFVVTGVREGTRYVLDAEPVVVEDYRATLASWLGSFVPGSPDAVWPVAR